MTIPRPKMVAVTWHLKSSKHALVGTQIRNLRALALIQMLVDNWKRRLPATYVHTPVSFRRIQTGKCRLNLDIKAAGKQSNLTPLGISSKIRRRRNEGLRRSAFSAFSRRGIMQPHHTSSAVAAELVHVPKSLNFDWQSPR